MMKRLCLIFLFCVWPTLVLASEPVSLTESLVQTRVTKVSREGKIAQLQAALAQNEVLRAESPLDQRLLFEANHRIDASDRTSNVFGTRNDTTVFSGRYEKTFSTGTQASAGYSTNRATSNSPFATFDPAFEGAIDFSVRQPLLRGGFGKDLRAGIGAAKASAESAQAQSDRALEQISVAARQTYWAWVSLKQEEEVDKRAIARAREFLRITKNKRRLGTAEDEDLYSAESNLASREQDSLRTKEATRSVERQLQNLLLYPVGTTFSQGEKLELGSPPQEQTKYVEQAVSIRKDYQASEKQVQAQENLLEAAKSQYFPRVDLLSTLRLNEVDDGWGKAAGGALVSDKPNWFIGGELEIPLSNRYAKAEKRKAELELRILKLERSQLRDNIETDVRVAWQKLQDIREQVNKATQVERLEARKLNARERDFKRGRSDALSVLLGQQDLLRAERSRLVLLARAAQARANLELVTGSAPQAEARE